MLYNIYSEYLRLVKFYFFGCVVLGNCNFFGVCEILYLFLL